MSIPALLLKKEFRSYRKVFIKGLPLVSALLVLILIVADKVKMLLVNQDLVSTHLPLIYAVLLLLIAGRRILFLKYPPFFFSWPGLYFFLTAPVNHRLVLVGRILISYLPLLLLSIGWGILAGPVQTGLLDGAGLFFCLAAMANISWLLYNAATNRLRILLWKILSFLTVLVLLVVRIPGYIWAIIAATSFGWAIYIVDQINWSKYERHCRMAHLSRKYLLNGDWGGLETLAYEYRSGEPPIVSFLTARMYANGSKAFTYEQILLISRYPLLSWVFFLGQYAFSIILIRKGELRALLGGSLLLLLGFVALFSLPVQKMRQKMAEGLFPVGGFNEFFTGMFILPTAVALVLLMAVFFFVPPGINQIWQMAAALFPAAVLAYLAVAKGMCGPVFTGWFMIGGLLFGLLFSFIYSAVWKGAFLVLLLFIPYLRFSWRKMKKIYEGAEL